MISKLYLPALLIMIISCTGVKLSQKIVISGGDWLMSGRQPEQTNIAYYELAPPLNKVWDYDIDAGVGSSGIAVADAVVFVNSLAGEMITLDVTTGGKIGSLKFLGKDAATAPLVRDNYVIVTYAGDNKYSAAAYDLLEGNIMWRKNYGYIQTSPVLMENAVYFSSSRGNTYKIEDSTGKLVWKYTGSEQVHSTCAVSGNKMVFGTDKGSVICLNTGTGLEEWRIKTIAPVYSTPMIAGGNVYFGADDSSYYSVNLSSGSIAWKRNMKTKITAGSALFNDSTAVFGGINGFVYALNIYTGELLWNFLTYGTIISSPVVSGKYIYITSYDSRVYCLEGISGSVLWKSGLENKSRTTPVVWKDFLFVSADKSIICFSGKDFERSN